MDNSPTTTQEKILTHIIEIAVWAKGMIVLPKVNKRSVFYFVLGISFGIFYAWQINPPVYVGANIYDLADGTQLPTTLAISQLMYAVKDHPYSVNLVVELINDLGIGGGLFCEAQKTYLNFDNIMNTVIYMLGITC